MNDNERPTPLTDAAWADKEQNILVHAKNLERSLAERTEERDKLLEKQSWLIAHPTAIEAAHQVVEWTKCEQERDTALSKLAALTAERDDLAQEKAELISQGLALAVDRNACAAERDALKADKERLDWLGDYFSITAEESCPWREFEALVHQKGFRAAIDAELERKNK
jgi:hypothetical protein